MMSTTSAPPIGRADRDRDEDLGAPYDDTNNNRELHYGHAASAADRRAIASVIKHYYAIALAENGAQACSMLYSTIAEAVPESYGQTPPGPAYMKGTTCPSVLTALFKYFHDQLKIEVPRLTVAQVRLEESHGFAVLTFGTLPERRMSFKRERGAWKIESLLDGPLS